MSASDSRTCPFREEMAAIVCSMRPSIDPKRRDASFEALRRLERLALVGGASDATLRDIAEARFLVGILREAVRPPRPAPLRAMLRARAACA